ncbi:MAG TPA: carboxypeptidase-like regulatory domain-containing protein [Gemmatimonadaceae bacterium]|nr:carboxypeptidase-like regulatory domain-containing protein [Gemmatimonadaceae bacterium]
MNVARHSRCLSLQLVAGLLVALGCRESAKPSAAAAQHAAGDTSTRSIGAPSEVVIARPSQPYVVEAVATPGTVTGTISTSAPIAAGPPQPTGRDSALCGATIPDLSVTQQGNALGGVVVWLDGARRGKALPLERRLELESTDCKLSPRVQAAVTSSAVNVLGHDPFRQHLRFLAAGEREPRASILLGRDEQVIPTERPFSTPGLVVVKDVDHPWPTAYIAVFDHPYFAVTAPNGTFTIDGVPPGKYVVRGWHERTGKTERAVEVGEGGTTRVDLVVSAK